MIFIKIHRCSDRLLTPHFRESEFFCKSLDFKGDYHLLAQSLVMGAEIIREFVDTPLLIASSYRTPDGNRACGGSPDSFHLRGMAIDLRCPLKQDLINENITRKGFLYHSLRSPGINGFGIGERFLHIDTRRSGYTEDADFGSYAMWNY